METNDTPTVPAKFDTKTLYPNLLTNEDGVRYVEIEGDRRIAVLEEFSGANEGLQAFFAQYRNSEAVDANGEKSEAFADIQHAVATYGPNVVVDMLNTVIANGSRLKAKAQVANYADATVQQNYLHKLRTENPVLLTPEAALEYRPGVRTPTDFQGWLSRTQKLMALAKKATSPEEAERLRAEARAAFAKANELMAADTQNVG